jgi:cyclin-dependent kinase regulatory subunit CKS1
LKLIPKSYFNPDDSGVLRLLSENEWRGIGITQSLGWAHYEVHGMPTAILLPFAFEHSSFISTFTAPEPHVLLFRRAKNFDVAQAHAQLLAQQQQAAKGTKRGKK